MSYAGDEEGVLGVVAELTVAGEVQHGTILTTTGKSRDQRMPPG